MQPKLALQATSRIHLLGNGDGCPGCIIASDTQASTSSAVMDSSGTPLAAGACRWTAHSLPGAEMEIRIAPPIRMAEWRWRSPFEACLPTRRAFFLNESGNYRPRRIRLGFSSCKQRGLLRIQIHNVPWRGHGAGALSFQSRWARVLFWASARRAWSTHQARLRSRCINIRQRTMMLMTQRTAGETRDGW